MFKRGSTRMSVWITGRNVEIIQNTSLFNQMIGKGKAIGQFHHQMGNHMPPSFLVKIQMQGFQSLFSSLMSSKTGPVDRALPV